MGFKREEVGLTKEAKSKSLQKDENLFRSVILSDSGIVTPRRGVTEQRIPLADLEKIYRMDGLVFGIVNKYVRDVTGTSYSIVGEDEYSRMTIENIVRNKKIGFQKMLRFAVRDSLVYGFGIFELVYTRDRTELLKILRVDPTTVEFKKLAGRVVVDVYGYPLEFEYTDPYTGEKKILPRENTLFITFFPLREGDIGISPLEVLYKPILFKLNVEEASGEDIWRRGFPPIIVNIGDEKHYPSEKETEAVTKDIKGLKSRTAFIFPYWTKIKALETGTQANVEGFLDYFSNLIRECLGLPRIASSEVGAIDYERTVLALQIDLAEQIEEQLFTKLAREKKLKEVPRMKFAEQSAAMRLSKARRWGVYARSGLLTRDLSLEKAIRIDEGLPINELTPEREWERQHEAEKAKKVRLSKREEDDLYGKEEK